MMRVKSMPDEAQRKIDRQRAIEWAVMLCEMGDYVVLDTETTGANPNVDEPCTISIIDHDGQVLLDTLLRPSLPISHGASRVHSVMNDDVRHLPTIVAHDGLLRYIFKHSPVVIYNAPFDVGVLNSAAQGQKLPPYSINALDAMQQYAAFRGEWNDYYGNYRWHKLTVACEQMNIPEPNEKAHSALGDVVRTRNLILAMARSE